jgi:hypothetical protein
LVRQRLLLDMILLAASCAASRASTMLLPAEMW